LKVRLLDCDVGGLRNPLCSSVAHSRRQ
jgi:hypothetical protein